jgi:hypothetical protein
MVCVSLMIQKLTSPVYLEKIEKLCSCAQSPSHLMQQWDEVWTSPSSARAVPGWAA